MITGLIGIHIKSSTDFESSANLILNYRKIYRGLCKYRKRNQYGSLVAWPGVQKIITKKYFSYYHLLPHGASPKRIIITLACY